jgi:hypothetical protein
MTSATPPTAPTPFDWSADEAAFAVAAGVVAVATLGPLARDLLRVRPFGPAAAAAAGRRWVLAGVVAGVGACGVVLARWADPVHVVGHLDYTLLFAVGAAAWVGGVVGLMPWLGGVGVRDDVLERGNAAAGVVAAAAALGAGLVYALCNVGRGDTIGTTLVPAAAATAAWLVLWLLLATATGVADRVAIDRDPAAAGRLAAYLLASAAVLGTAMAGDFDGYGRALADFAVFGWPALVLWGVAAAAERRHRPTAARPVGRVGADSLPTIAVHAAILTAALLWRVAVA